MFAQFLKSAWADSKLINKQHADTAALFWEREKAYMRGRIMSFASTYKRENNSSFNQASLELRNTQMIHQTNPTLDTKRKWLDLKN